MYFIQGVLIGKSLNNGYTERRCQIPLSYWGIIGCVAAGLGISMLPQSVITKHVQNGIIRQHSIPNLYGKVKTVFIYRKDKYVPASLIKFINMICDEEELLDNKRLI